MDAEERKVSLFDEAGRERIFTVHDALKAEQDTYYLVESVEDRAEVLVLRETAEGLETVSSPELERVLELFEEEDDDQAPEQDPERDSPK